MIEQICEKGVRSQIINYDCNTNVQRDIGRDKREHESQVGCRKYIINRCMEQFNTRSKFRSIRTVRCDGFEFYRVYNLKTFAQVLVDIIATSRMEIAQKQEEIAKQWFWIDRKLFGREFDWIEVDFRKLNLSGWSLVNSPGGHPWNRGS